MDENTGGGQGGQRSRPAGGAGVEGGGVLKVVKLR